MYLAMELVEENINIIKSGLWINIALGRALSIYYNNIYLLKRPFIGATGSREGAASRRHISSRFKLKPSPILSRDGIIYKWRRVINHAPRVQPFRAFFPRPHFHTKGLAAANRGRAPHLHVIYIRRGAASRDLSHICKSDRDLFCIPMCRYFTMYG